MLRADQESLRRRVRGLGGLDRPYLARRRGAPRLSGFRPAAFSFPPFGARRALVKLVALAAIALAALLLPAGADATPAPAWRLTGSALPTNFRPGSSSLYFLAATNVGAAPTSGPQTLRLNLPEKVLARSVQASGGGPGAPAPSCAIGARRVTCTAPGPFSPGAILTAAVEVEPAADATGVLAAGASISAAAGPATAIVISTDVGAEPPPPGFLPGVAGLGLLLGNADGSADTEAGTHPYLLGLHMAFPSRQAAGSFAGVAHPRDIRTALPAGLLIDPRATPVLCTEAELIASACPAASQIGTISILAEVLSPSLETSALYNMVPPPGSATNFGFEAAGVGIFIHLLGNVSPDADYSLAADVDDILAKYPLLGIQLQLWGEPGDPSHDTVRGGPVERRGPPLITMPRSCTPPSASVRLDTWEQSGIFIQRSASAADLIGCERLPFAPILRFAPREAVAATPSALLIDLHQPQGSPLGMPAAANLQATSLALPAGLDPNLAAADGLATCAPAQVGLGSEAPAACPDASKLGRVALSTPLLDHPLPGSLYLAEPAANPFGSLLALYLVLEEPLAGIVVKLPGAVEIDPIDGRLTASFDRLPQIPFEDLELELFGGPRAALRTPDTCGTFLTDARLTPSSGRPPTESSPAFAISAGAGERPCAASEHSLANDPELRAGTVIPAAGLASPLTMRLRREGGTQPLGAFALRLPPGLSASIAALPPCPGPALELAAERSGQEELEDPSCPPSSRLGSVDVAAGAGPRPFHVPGSAYLAGPYRGAPFSIAAIVPALAGPLDLGTVVLRVALHIDPQTAAVTAISDPLPLALRGIPLDIRSLALRLDRSGFIRNPTSCDPTQISADITAPSGALATVSDHFQLGACAELGLKPRLLLRLSGGVGRNAHPTASLDVDPRPGDANLRSASLSLPYGLFIDPARLRATCPRARFAVHDCPPSTRIGWAEVTSPLLAAPERGHLYLMQGERRLPDLAASLGGQVDLDLQGHLEARHTRLRASFDSLPDIPVSHLRLILKGGLRGLLVNSEGLCRGQPPLARAFFIGHNAEQRQIRSRAKVKCPR